MKRNNEYIKLDGSIIPIEEAIKLGFISEKDIKEKRIMDDYNAKDCEQCSSDSVCCYCQNLAWYKLNEQLKAKEQECEKWQVELAYKVSELRNIEERIKPLMKRPDDLDYYDLEWIVWAFADDFKQLKKENEELSKEVQYLKSEIERISK